MAITNDNIWYLLWNSPAQRRLARILHAFHLQTTEVMRGILGKILEHLALIFRMHSVNNVTSLNTVRSDCDFHVFISERVRGNYDHSYFRSIFKL